MTSVKVIFFNPCTYKLQSLTLTSLSTQRITQNNTYFNRFFDGKLTTKGQFG